MGKLRLGMIGLGNMGSYHTRYLMQGEVPNVELTAVCDSSPDRLAWAQENLCPNVRSYHTASDLFASGQVDGVLIATPHYSHPPLAIEAFGHGLHVLTEKPAGVYTKQVREMNEAAAASGKVFGIMYNQRTNPVYQKMRELIQSGEIGEIRRTHWIITNWYRPQAYYNSGGWRATWAGEGGGVLINQCPHNLDLWQWICGMPVRVQGFCSFGKYHTIEVEDDVTAYVEYANGATGVFVTSTGDAPGTNRLEVTGDRGKLVLEDGKLTFWRLRQTVQEFSAQTQEAFASPEVWKCDIPVGGVETAHQGILTNWADAVLKGTPLLAPGEEGIRGLHISNAIHLSSWTGGWVSVPVDEEIYYHKLQEKVRSSQEKKDVQPSSVSNLNGTF